jgi:signal peptidase II
VQAARRAPLTSPPSRGRLPVVIGVAAAVVAVDAVSKAVVVDRLAHRPPVRLIDGVLDLELTRNAGAAFSVGVGSTVVFSVIALVVVVVIVRSARGLGSLGWAVVLGLLLGGATGNLADRLFRAPGPLRGRVVDWIHLTHWPVFNVADSAITCGAVLAVALSLTGRPLTVDAPPRP